jgi:hypothetical protein
MYYKHRSATYVDLFHHVALCRSDERYLGAVPQLSSVGSVQVVDFVKDSASFLQKLTPEISRLAKPVRLD